MKKLVHEYEFTEEQQQRVRAMADELSLTETVVRVLFARGIDTADKIRAFLSPSREHFLSPYLMSGMQEAVQLLRQAKEEGWNVVVFGDYDADGICASSIMYHGLRAFGITPYVRVPERSEGYGLTTKVIDEIMDEFFPDLFITVDCGISNHDEVEYIKAEGTLVIVTDHHEFRDPLPDCVCINPKIQDDYPYDNLCGAGVAFKLMYALIGEEAYGLLDFAALATVADSVPLLGENRDIVHEGLRLIAEKPRPAFSALLGKAHGDEISEQTLAFTLAPRINAAGRMGTAATALRLFMSEDPEEIADLVARLSEYNAQRQRICDELYESAKAKIKETGAYGNVIMLSDDSWDSGFVGIAAARIAEEYCRPTLLFAPNGEALKGSARSIEGVNIYEALEHCCGYIEEFGGHAQAAGINVKREKFEDLKRALDEWIGETYGPSDFVPKVYVGEEIEEKMSLKLAKELKLLEPYGVGHRRPLFYISANRLSARPVKAKSQHILVHSDYLDMMYFNGEKQQKLLESDVSKKVIFECDINQFRGKESVRGIVRDVVYDGMSGDIGSWRFAMSLKRLHGSSAVTREKISLMTHGEIDALVREKRAESAYGLCVMASDTGIARSYESVRDMAADLIQLSSHNVRNVLLISAAPDADLSEYREFVFLDVPCNFNLKGIAGKPCYVAEDEIGYGDFLDLDISREELLRVFGQLRAHAPELSGSTIEETAQRAQGLGFSVRELMFALAVFCELGLVSYEYGHPVVYRGVKADLNSSRIYRKALRLQSRG